MLAKPGEYDLTYLWNIPPPPINFPVTFEYCECLFGKSDMEKPILDEFSKYHRIQLDKLFKKKTTIMINLKN